jgi:thymidylate synthase
MLDYEQRYRKLVSDIMIAGHVSNSRCGMTRSLYGKHLSVDLRYGFPILFGRRMYFESVLGEFVAMIKGETTVDKFNEYGCNYWDKFADEEGNLDIGYGDLWRNYEGTDQIANLIKGIKEVPDSRRLLVTGWDPKTAYDKALPCCHLLYQFYVVHGSLNMIWTQRSADVMLGFPNDVMFASIFLSTIARITSLEPRDIHFSLGDAHIYKDHFEGVTEYFRRDIDYTTNGTIKKPKLIYTGPQVLTLDNIDVDTWDLEGYSGYKKPINFALLGAPK